MNPLDLIGLALDAADKQPIVDTLSDAGLLYEDYLAFKAGTLKISALARAGKLVPLARAFAREAALFERLVENPADEERIAALAAKKGL